MIKRIMELHLFDGDSEGGTGNDNDKGGTFTYEQLDEIAKSRAARAEASALKSYFQQQGLTEEEARSAMQKFKEDREKAKPNVSAIEKERDEALEKLKTIENNNLLRSKGIKAEDLDYVSFKVNKLVDDKTTFEKAAEKFLKENPRFATTGNYKVSTGTSTHEQGAAADTNSAINNAIRNAIRR